MAPLGENIDYRLDSTVDGIDVSGGYVELHSGDNIHYDRLLIATGGRQKTPPIPGLDPSVVRPFITLEDAENLDARIKAGQKALVIGGGLIGLKAAEALHSRGMSVTVVELLPWVMPSVLDARAGKVVSDHLQRQGLDVRTGTTVKEIAAEPDGSGNAILDDGSVINFVVAVLATGVEPKMFVKEIAGLQVQHGIVVDELGRTNVEGVFAAGDVAEGPDPLRGCLATNLNWTSAREQGRIAGCAMVGASDEYYGSVALNSLTFMGCPVITMGITAVPDAEADAIDMTELTDPTLRSGVYRKLIFREGKIVGAILVGDIAFSGTYHRLIRDSIEVGDLGNELLSGGRRFIQRIEELRREDMEGSHSWRQHVWEEIQYRKKMNTQKWKRRTDQSSPS